MSGGFGPAGVLSCLRGGLGEGLTGVGFAAEEAGARLTWSLTGAADLQVQAHVMEHPDDAPHGQSFTFALAAAGVAPQRIGLLMDPDQTARVRRREREVLLSLPANDVTAYRLAVLERTGEDLRPRDQWLTAGGPADVSGWLDLLGPWLPGWAASVGASPEAVATLRQGLRSTASAG